MAGQLKSGRFYGRTLRRRTAGGVTLADVSYPAGGRLPRHSHERAYFCLIRRGSYSEVYGRRVRTCGPMTLAFHPPGEPHAETFAGSTVSSFNVEIGVEWLHRMSEFARPLDQPAEFHGGEVAALGLRLFTEFSREDVDSDLAIESLTLEILAASSGCGALAGTGQPTWLANARELLEAQFHQAVTLRGVAQQAGVHPVYFAAAFRRFYGCSVGEYLRRRRLEFARRRLSDPAIPLAEIALEAGFADQSHLTRTFKRFTGKTPAQYRTFLPFKTA